MTKFLLPLLFLFISIISCKNNEDKGENVKDPSVIAKSINSLKSGTGTVRDFIIEPDSVKNNRKIAYVKLMTSKYPEYSYINKFFTTHSPYLLEFAGDFYRVKDLKITDKGTVLHKFDDIPNEVKYFYDAENNYYIYTFDISNISNPLCTNIRRIKKGRFSVPAHDLVFENRRLVKEDFVADVSKSFFVDEGQQFFEMKMETEDGKVENLINLGPAHNF